MSVCVAEYLGQRTDVTTSMISPIIIPPKTGSGSKTKVNWNASTPCPICPFTNNMPCSKLYKGNEPICCVRKEDGTLWINCKDRLCSTKTKDLSPYQSNILLQVGQHIFSNSLTYDDIRIKNEVPLQLSGNKKNDYYADFVITYKNGLSPYSGPDRLVLEMQGGGETSNTGSLTRHIHNWKSMAHPTNTFLKKMTTAGTLETNAWRRQQEQFIVKGNIAMKTWKGYGIAFCVGTLLFDYLMNRLKSANLPDLKDYNWTLALIAFKENNNAPPTKGAIPLTVDESRLLYTNYQTFVQALINQGLPSLDAFRGDFIDLNNKHHIIP